MKQPKPEPDADTAPRVSIILPVHNGATFLESAIASILAQSFTDLELICVDDGSTDSSPAILAAAAGRDPRVRLVRHERNVGLPMALNSGFRLAQGAYFTWTSDDNLLRPEMIARLVAALDANSECSVAYSAYTVIDTGGVVVGTIWPGPVDELLMGNMIGASFLYRRAVDFALGGYDSDLFGAEDYDFWLRASAHFAFLAVPEDLYLYRKHPRSLTNSRAAAIQMLTTMVVLRALPANLPRQKRAAVLLSLYHRNHVRLRIDLVLRAAALAPFSVLTQLPRIGWHAARLLRQLLRRKL